MVSCLTDLHLWTLKNQTIVPDNTVGVFTYHDKKDGKEIVVGQQSYLDEKSAYTESRDVTWAPKNKKPEKLRDILKEVEELLSAYRCLRAEWLSRRLLQMILSNGIIITFVVSSHTGDVDRIFIDKSLVNKLSGEAPSDILLTDSYLVACYPDRQKLDFIYFMKKLESPKRFEKLAAFDPKTSQLDVPGPTGRRLDRQVGCSLHKDIVYVWWPTASEEAWPWSPMTGEKERANLILYSVNGPKLEMIAFTRTECDPLDIRYSMENSHQILSIEQSEASGGEYNLDVSIYECNRGKINKYSTVTIPLKSGVVAFGRSVGEDKILFGCQDGTLVLYDDYTKLTHLSTGSLLAQSVSWHPSGTVVVVADSRGDMQVFDLALTPLKVQLVAEEAQLKSTLDISTFFRSAPGLRKMVWSPEADGGAYAIPECSDHLALMFDRGPVGVLQLYLGVMGQGIISPLALTNEYVKNRQLDQAISLLSGLCWNLEGTTCYACLSVIVNHLLRMPLNQQRENQLEATLATFYAPPRPLSEAIVLQFREAMSRLARRFFFHLVRCCRFDKAFLLAVDVGAKDLFMDLHYMATDKGETSLAEVCLRKADAIDAASLAGSVPGFDDESVTEESESEEEESYSSEEEYANMIAATAARQAARLGQLQRSPHQIQTMSSQPHQKSLTPPPPPEFANPPLDPRFLPNQHVISTDFEDKHKIDMSEVVLQNLEEELAAQMLDEYTETLMEGPILPPPPSHADDAQQLDVEESTGVVRVIHFGIV